ncbi:MAG: hypothetical protein QXD89_02630 [Candidatus Aenigmatarchaeota archaeon]
MKIISSFVATILLIGFTVAIGAIISSWLFSYTRTTTREVSSITCKSGSIDLMDVSVLSIDPSTQNLTSILIRNRGKIPLYISSITVMCGSSFNITNLSDVVLSSASQLIFEIIIPSTQKPCALDYSNIGVLVAATCEGGGNVEGECSGVGCKLY